MKFAITLTLVLVASISSVRASSQPATEGAIIMAHVPTTPADTSSPVFEIVIGLAAAAALGMRMANVHHARELACHEQASYRGKQMMFRTLHEGGADH